MSSLGADFPTITPPGHDAKIRDIYKDMSYEALEQLRQWLTVNPIPTPISQVQGYIQVKPQVARVTTAEATTGTHTTYQSLATPLQITGLPDGQYQLLYASTVTGIAGAGNAMMSPKYSGSEAIDADAAQTAGALGVIINAATVILNAGGNNTVLMRHRTSTNVASTYAQRLLLIFRYANL